ncbi:MAG: hypothetical protein ACRELB_20670 [Polyangiaceae bacterium]
MKTAISIPDSIFRAAEQTARRLRVSRSELYAKAVAAYVEAHRGEGVTDALNRVYAKADSSLDPALARMQNAALRDSGHERRPRW